MATRTDWLQRTFRAYESKLVHYAWSIVGDVETARDIAQDTFLKLCQASPEAVGDPPNAWLYKICRNRAIDHYRKQKHRSFTDLEHVQNEIVEENDASRQLVKKEQKAEMLMALATLSEREQEIVRLKFLHDFSYKQIAENVGLSVSNVGVILHGSLVKLRERILGKGDFLKKIGQETQAVPDFFEENHQHRNSQKNNHLRVFCQFILKAYFPFRFKAQTKVMP